MLQIQNLVVRYGGITAVDGITMNIAEHETVALIGANGAGKTTTLHAISGLLKAADGEILFHDTDITKIPADQIVSLGVIQVPEGRQVFAKLTIEENLRLAHICKKTRRRSGRTMKRR